MGQPAWAGCRYTNPEWDSLTSNAPVIQAAVTSGGDTVQIMAKWNQSWVSQYPQCVDSLYLQADSGLGKFCFKVL